MKAEQLREQSDEELVDLYEDTARELFDLQMKKASGDTSQPFVKMRLLRRDLARIRTIQRQREQQPAETADTGANNG